MNVNKIITLLLLVGISSSLSAQNPKWFKKARKTQLTLITYDAQNNMHQGQGYFVGEKGEVLAEYDLLKGAVKGTAVDTEGKQYDITHIMGASALYNVVKLELGIKKSNAPQLAANTQQAHQLVYIMPICNNDKKAECLIDTIAKAEEFGEEKFPYYTLSKAFDERYAGCPVFNEEGELLGHIQLPARQSDKPAFVIGAKYGNSLTISALDINNNDLKTISIAKMLPDDEQQAATFLYLTNKSDKVAYEQLVMEFMSKFPNNNTGYIQLAELQAVNQEYAQAQETYSTAFKSKADKQDEIHHSFAKLLYQAGLQEKAPYEGWDMNHALEEAVAAYEINPQPLYKALQGLCLYALKRYDESYDCFMSMSQTKMRSAEYFIYAAQCKQMQKASMEEVLALQDSAVNCFTKPYPKEAANYLYLRSKTLAELERYRDAVTDLNEYEHLASGNVSSRFYYEREQMEMKCRMYPAALNDIERAVKMTPDEPLFRAEEAVVNYRVGQFDQAIEAAKEAIRLDDSFSDAHRILGICLREKGKMEEAKKALKRAVELGDTMAQSVLEKMQ